MLDISLYNLNVEQFRPKKLCFHWSKSGIMEETIDLIGELSDYSDDTNEEGNCDVVHIQPISPNCPISFNSM